MPIKQLYIAIVFLCFLSCREEEQSPSGYLPDLPAHFPELKFPDDNSYTEERWELGKLLFYSNLLSVDSTLNCGSCHQVEYAFTDQLSLPIGVQDRLGDRNVTSLSNVAYHPYYTRDGALTTLEMQALVPIQEHAEFDFNIVAAGARLSMDPVITELSRRAYDREPDPFVITRALSTFQRTIVSSDAKYDRVLEGELTFSELEQKGYDLFISERLGCQGCHNGFDFTDYTITNNGLYLEYSDPGRYQVTLDEADRATFKVPSLRNLSVTYPYMHDGSLHSLSEVIEHYETGIQPHANLDARIKTFSLLDSERSALEAFLLTLDDIQFIGNPNYLE